MYILKHDIVLLKYKQFFISKTGGNEIYKICFQQLKETALRASLLK